MAYEMLFLEKREGVGVITLNRPERLNAINSTLKIELDQALTLFERDEEVKAVVVTGAGEKAFSAGADIGRFPSMLGDAEASAQYARDCAKVQMFMDQMDKPVVAALNGLAMGGGLEIAIRCHSIVAMQNAILQFPEITLGILPGIGGCVVPYRRWPQGAALFHDMICFGKPLTAAEAAGVGMVAELADNYPRLFQAAIDEIGKLQGRVGRIPDGKVDIPAISIPAAPMAGRQPLSKEAVDCQRSG